MLTIRPEQLAALAAARRETFLDRLLPEVRRRHGVTADAETRAAMAAAIDAAAQYGINTEHDVARFIHLWFALGAEFDTSPRFPWASALLAETRLTPAQRMDRVYAEGARWLDLRAAAAARAHV